MKSHFPRWLLALGCAALGVGLTACGSSSEGSASASSSGGKPMETWIHGIVTPKGDAGFAFMAQEKGFFAKQGVNVEFKPFIGNIQEIQALLAGSIDSASTAPATVIDADLKGGDLKIIGSTMPKLNYQIISQSSIKSLADLKGKLVGTSAPGAEPEAVVKAMLVTKGIDPNSVKIVNAGGTPERFAALMHGRIDAAMTSPDFVPQIKASHGKLHVLANILDVVPFFMRDLIVANGNSLKEKPQAAAAFVAAEMQGISYALHHRQAEIDLTAKKLNEPASSPSIAYDYDSIEKTGAASPKSEIPAANIEQLQSFRIEAGFQERRLDPSKFIDPSVREKALKLVAGKIPEVQG